MKYSRKWEAVNDDTFRMSVPGGWLVNTDNSGEGAGLCFLPDPKNEWLLDQANCQECGVYMGSGNGYPDTCKDCLDAQ